MPRSDLYLIIALAEIAAAEAIGSYGREDWKDSPLGELLPEVVNRCHDERRTVPLSVIEAIEKVETARERHAVDDDLFPFSFPYPARLKSPFADEDWNACMALIKAERVVSRSVV